LSVRVFLRGEVWHSYDCVQMVGWIKMPLGKEVGIGPVHIVLHSDPMGSSAPHSSPSPLFGSCLLWPNGRLSQQMLSSCSCDAIRTSNGVAILCVDKRTYLGIFSALREFQCSLTNAKKSFYRSAYAIFGKFVHIAPEEATQQLHRVLENVWLAISFTHMNRF